VSTAQTRARPWGSCLAESADIRLAIPLSERPSTSRRSTSWLQRKLQLGYNRAARIVETMEKRGLVGPSNGAKDREVLIDAM
jgi:DNA-binding MarR family transcriptional regulator